MVRVELICPKCLHQCLDIGGCVFAAVLITYCNSNLNLSTPVAKTVVHIMFPNLFGKWYFPDFFPTVGGLYYSHQTHFRIFTK